MSRVDYGEPVPKKERLILVEGINDAHLIGALANEEKVSESLQVLCYKQAGKLAVYLDLLVKHSDFAKVRRIGLTRDADQGPGPALQSLQDAWHKTLATLAALRLNVPECRYFALPDNWRTGRVENLCLDSPVYPKVMSCAEQMFACATAVATYSIDREKATVAAYLSMMEKPGVQLGTAGEAGYWDLRSNAFDPLRQFLRSVAE